MLSLLAPCVRIPVLSYFLPILHLGPCHLGPGQTPKQGVYISNYTPLGQSSNLIKNTADLFVARPIGACQLALGQEHGDAQAFNLSAQELQGAPHVAGLPVVFCAVVLAN